MSEEEENNSGQHPKVAKLTISFHGGSTYSFASVADAISYLQYGDPPQVGNFPAEAEDDRS